MVWLIYERDATLAVLVLVAVKNKGENTRDRKVI